MSTHKAVQVPSANEALTVVEVDTVSPPPGHVRLDMAACGVCGTDREFHAGHFPGLQWPLTLGHEIAGTVAEVGDAEPRLRRIDRDTAELPISVARPVTKYERKALAGPIVTELLWERIP